MALQRMRFARYLGLTPDLRGAIIHAPQEDHDCEHQQHLEEGVFPGADRRKVSVVHSDPDDWGLWIESPQVIRIARDDDVSMLPGENHDRSVDDIRGASGAAEFPARAREVFVKRHNFDFCSPQKPSECDLCGVIAPSLPHNARGYPKISALSQNQIEQSDHSPVTAIQRDQRTRVQGHPRRRGGNQRLF